MAKVPGCNMEFMREDDFVEYFIFPEVPDSLVLSPSPSSSSREGTTNSAQIDELRDYMEKVLKQCTEIIESYVKKHRFIWHKDEMKLQVRTGCPRERLLDDEEVGGQPADKTLPPHLYGVTHYGDNIADEWFMVYVLSKLTQGLTSCIVRVVDSDGEFMLIEAAEVLPRWANPDTCEQRVYIADGCLQLVQNSPSNTAQVLPVATAVSKIRQNPTLYRVSPEIQSCISERFKEFEDPSMYLHRQIVRLPLGVAALLRERPSFIAPAVRAFCERDPIDMKVCRTMRYFPPEQCVRTNIVFTRCLYAMIMHSQYVPDRKIGWKMNSDTNSEEYKEDLLGVKIACGFEILATQAKTVAEENDPSWRAYVRSLTAKGYFDGNIDGSEGYVRKLNEAKAYYKLNNERYRTAPLVGKEMLELLNKIDINADDMRDDEENNLQPSDSDDWLNITAEQLDAMLIDRYGPQKLYKPNGDIDAGEFTKNIAEFLEKQSMFDGVDNDTDDSGDDDGEPNSRSGAKAKLKTKARNSDEFKAKVKKNSSMRKACRDNSMLGASTSKRKQTSASGKSKEEDSETTHVKNFLDFVIPEDNWDTNSDMSDYEDEDDLERNIEAMTKPEMDIDSDIKEYMAQMDRELANTTVGRSFEADCNARRSTGGPIEDDFDDIESFEPININVNTLKNMMDSYKSQLGGSGPVTNLLSAMGVGMSVASNATDKANELSESTV